MKTVNSIYYISDSPCVVALGCFDGVHLGHKAVISEAAKAARMRSCPCAVWTFSEPPKNYFSPASVPIITTNSLKAELIEELGADVLVCVPFDADICAMSAEDFFETVLIERMRACHIVCGFNYSFGARGSGNTELLSKLCKERGIGLSIVPPVSIDGCTVSSSAIRFEIENGNPENASAYLGRPYALEARVIDGQKLARRLGFPTLNQSFPEGALIPRHGVYAVRVLIDGNAPLLGISNVGIRPTVGGDTVYTETHIFDFDGDLYGKKIKIEFISFIRPEVRFDTVDALAEQVKLDIKTAKEILKY